MKKTLLVALLVPTLCLSVVLAACAVPQITLPGAGTGTEEDPFVAEVQNGSKTTIDVTLVNATEFVVEKVSGDSATAKAKESKIEVSGVKVGETTFKISDAENKTAVYLKVTVTPIPATSLSLPEMTEGDGTRDSLYYAYMNLSGANRYVDIVYTVSPSNTDEVVTAELGGFSNNEFVAHTSHPFEATVENGYVRVAYVTPNANDSVVCKISVGEHVKYVSVQAKEYSLRTSWEKSELKSDWALTENSKFNDDEGAGFDLMANSAISTKLKFDGTHNALLVRARMNRDDSQGTGKLYVKIGNRYASIVGFEGDTFTLEKSGENMRSWVLFDLSDVVNGNWQISIGNDSENDHMLITEVHFVKMPTDVSEKSAWTSRDEIAADWSHEFAAPQYRSGVGEGFDLNTWDDDAMEYIFNTIHVAEDAPTLFVKVRRFGQDGKANAIIVTINGKAIAPLGYSDAKVVIEDTDGRSTSLAYDLTEYAGKDVVVAIIQPVEKCGHLVLQRIEMPTLSASERSEWVNNNGDASDIEGDFVTEYASTERFNEGLNLNTDGGHGINALIYNDIAVTADNPLFFAKVRRFGQGDRVNDQDVSLENKILVFANGTLLTPFGYESGEVVVPDIDRQQQQLVYDLSAYVGKTVRIIIMQPVANTSRFVITQIKMTSWGEKNVDTDLVWNKQGMQNNWNRQFAQQYRDGVGEGFDLNTCDDDFNEFIYNYITVGDETNFSVKYRRFGQDGGRENKLVVLVNGVALKAVGEENAYIVVPDDDGVERTATYDLSAYKGQTIQIAILQPVPNTGHLVLMEVRLDAPAA